MENGLEYVRSNSSTKVVFVYSRPLVDRYLEGYSAENIAARYCTIQNTKLVQYSIYIYILSRGESETS